MNPDPALKPRNFREAARCIALRIACELRARVEQYQDNATGRFLGLDDLHVMGEVAGAIEKSVREDEAAERRTLEAVEHVATWPDSELPGIRERDTHRERDMWKDATRLAAEFTAPTLAEWFIAAARDRRTLLHALRSALDRAGRK